MIALHDFKADYAELLIAYLNNPKVTKFLTTRIPQPYRDEDAAWWINEGSKAGIVKAIEYDGAFVGAVGADRNQFEQSRTAEVGYWLSESYWGLGIATNAVRELSD